MQESPGPGARWRAIVAAYDATGRRATSDALQRAGIVVVAEAFDENDLVELVRYHEPDLLVMDVTMPGLDVISATRRMRGECPEPIVILLVTSATEELGVRGLRVGAAGYLRKDLDAQSLARAIVGALCGEAVIPRTVAMRLVEQLRGTTASGQRLRPVRSPLTARQWEVLDLVCEDMTTDDIATALAVSPKTVRSHIKGIFGRLDVSSREEAAAEAYRLRGLEL